VKAAIQYRLYDRSARVKGLSEMIGKATRHAHHIAQKFATDSQSNLGKTKKAVQGHSFQYLHPK